jgi:TetR/AcrR family transcriptional regulator, lmrAB and yxaGH operons repressor
MAYRTVSDDDLLDRALDLFRTYGFEGVSLSQLSEAIGLEKASLYHRYPSGKDEIVLAVVARVARWFGEHVFAPLKTAASPRARVAVVAKQLRVFYGDGTKPCITDVLSISGGSDELRTALRIALQAWLKAFAEIAKESGLSASLSGLRAEEAIVRIEGSLVVARVLGDSRPFQRVIKFLPDMLTGP